MTRPWSRRSSSAATAQPSPRPWAPSATASARSTPSWPKTSPPSPIRTWPKPSGACRASQHRPRRRRGSPDHGARPERRLHPRPHQRRRRHRHRRRQTAAAASTSTSSPRAAQQHHRAQDPVGRHAGRPRWAPRSTCRPAVRSTTSASRRPPAEGSQNSITDRVLPRAGLLSWSNENQTFGVLASVAYSSASRSRKASTPPVGRAPTPPTTSPAARPGTTPDELGEVQKAFYPRIPRYTRLEDRPRAPGPDLLDPVAAARTRPGSTWTSSIRTWTSSPKARTWKPSRSAAPTRPAWAAPSSATTRSTTATPSPTACSTGSTSARKTAPSATTPSSAR